MRTLALLPSTTFSHNSPQSRHWCRDETARPGADRHDGVALSAARRRKEHTYPELSGEGGRARLVVLAAEVGGRWSGEGDTCSAKAISAPPCTVCIRPARLRTSSNPFERGLSSCDRFGRNEFDSMITPMTLNTMSVALGGVIGHVVIRTK